MEAQPDVAAESLVQCALAVRGEKERQFGEALLVDPGWDILLQLYAANLRGESPPESGGWPLPLVGIDALGAPIGRAWARRMVGRLSDRLGALAPPDQILL